MNILKNSVVLASVALLSAGLAWAHGEPVAKRGGILAVMDEFDFELVVKADKIDLFTFDENEPVPSEKMSGSLTIINDTDKSKVDLVAAGINRLRATGVTAASGSCVIAIVSMPDGRSLAVQFAIP